MRLPLVVAVCRVDSGGCGPDSARCSSCRRCDHRELWLAQRTTFRGQRQTRASVTAQQRIDGHATFTELSQIWCPCAKRQLSILEMGLLKRQTQQWCIIDYKQVLQNTDLMHRGHSKSDTVRTPSIFSPCALLSPIIEVKYSWRTKKKHSL